jgi:hypothetical protein
MPLRVIAFLLAILMAAGVACPTALAAASDVAGLVDDGAADPEPAVVTPSVEMVVPARRELRQIVAPPDEPVGRLHRTWVFRPPRSFASR